MLVFYPIGGGIFALVRIQNTLYFIRALQMNTRKRFVLVLSLALQWVRSVRFDFWSHKLECVFCAQTEHFSLVPQNECAGSSATQ